jgi:hypothetical protein
MGAATKRPRQGILPRKKEGSCGSLFSNPLQYLQPSMLFLVFKSLAEEANFACLQP